MLTWQGLIMQRPTGRRLAGLLLAIMLTGMAAAAGASGRYGKYLPPDQAFQLQASATAQALQLHWQIADGYYLYRDKIEVQSAAVSLAALQLPAGQTKTDPYYGRSEIYRHAVQVTAP